MVPDAADDDWFGDGWADGNRAFCDFAHRGIVGGIVLSVRPRAAQPRDPGDPGVMPEIARMLAAFLAVAGLCVSVASVLAVVR